MSVLVLRNLIPGSQLLPDQALKAIIDSAGSKVRDEYYKSILNWLTGQFKARTWGWSKNGSTALGIAGLHHIFSSMENCELGRCGVSVVTSEWGRDNGKSKSNQYVTHLTVNDLETKETHFIMIYD